MTETFAQELIEFNRQVGAEDDELTDSVQRGLRAGIPERGRFLTGAEHLVGHFQKLIVSAVQGRRRRAQGRDGSSRRGDVAHDPGRAHRRRQLPDRSATATSSSKSSRSSRRARSSPRSICAAPTASRLYPWEPGQFLPIRVTIPGQDTPAMRTYTLSTAGNPDHYRLSIRRIEGGALVSPFLHANAKPGFRIEAMAPRGQVRADRGERAAGGADLGRGRHHADDRDGEQIVEEGKRTGSFRPVHFIHGAQSGQAPGLSRIGSANWPASIRPQGACQLQRRGQRRRLGVSHDSAGHIDIDLLKRILPFGDYDFYLCGPAALHAVALRWADRDGRAGRADLLRILRSGDRAEARGTAGRADTADAGERCARSRCASSVPMPARNGRATAARCWSSPNRSASRPTSAAARASAAPARRGSSSGAVEYIEEPVAPRGQGEVLLCCSVPRGDGDVVLDL